MPNDEHSLTDRQTLHLARARTVTQDQLDTARSLLTELTTAEPDIALVVALAQVLAINYQADVLSAH